MTPRPEPAPDGRTLTVKEQRAAARAQKTAEFKRQEAKRRRNRRIGIGAGIVGGVAIVGLVVASLVLAPKPPSYTAGGTGAEIEGVELFDNTSEHVEGPVDYPQNPPAGGPHHQVWLNCGVYEQPVPNENAVHSLEHGALWVTYDPALPEADVEALRGLMPRDYIVLSPYEGLDATVALSGWNSQLKVDSVDDPRIGEFIEEYWKSASVPEPGALCTGAYDAPGKVG